MSVPLQAVNCGVGSEIRHPRAPGLTTVLSGQVPALIVITGYLTSGPVSRIIARYQTRHYYQGIITTGLSQI